MLIYAIIPARKGSKGIIQKNLKLFGGKPLIIWSINIAQKSKYINRIIVSTNDDEIITISREAGADVPFKRPDDISEDLSTDYEFMDHCINWLKDHDEQIPDIFVQLRPTYPDRKLEIVDDAISKMIENYDKYDSLRSVCKTSKSPYKMYSINNEILVPLFTEINGIKEPYNRCRQEFPQIYSHNGYIDIVKSSTIINMNSMTGNNIYPFIMSENEIYDIDTIEQWKEAEHKFII